ncbi:MAG: hypothetical protein AB7R89_33610 [Dehalococcoidia bacterium]
MQTPMTAEMKLPPIRVRIEAPSALNGGRVQIELCARDPEGVVAAFAGTSCEVAGDA